MDYHSLDEKTSKIIENIDTLNNKISIIGSSVFKSISAVPPTLTLFFFSYFKTQQIIKKYFKF